MIAEKEIVKLQRRETRDLYTKFDPVLHYAKIKYNKKGEEIEHIPVAEKDVPYELRYPRSLWMNTVTYDGFLDAWIKKLEVYADALYVGGGTAVVQEMLKETSRTDYGVEPRTAEAIAREAYGDEEAAENETEETKT